MLEVPQPDELTVHQLEQALYDSRRSVSERKLRSLVAAESRQDERLALSVAEPPAVYPPATWRGAGQQDRYFRSLKLHPLHANIQPGVPAPGTDRLAVKAPRGRWKQHLLTALELVAALILVVVVVRLYQGTRSLSQAAPPPPTTAAQATSRPTATAAPTVAALQVLLPGEHPPPSRESATPEVVEPSLPALSASPTPEPRTAQRIEIPRIQVDAPIVAGDSYEALMMGVGQHLGSADPGQPGNMVLSAHNDIYGKIFRDLDKLEPGDEVLVYTDEGPYRYIVNSIEIVAPTRVDVMAPTEYGRLTMITCYPYLIDTHRVVVVADLTE